MNIPKNVFFPTTMKEWNVLDSDIWSPESLNVFKSKVIKFIRPKASSFFNCPDPEGVKLITRLRLGLSHLRNRKFKHKDCLNPICRSKQLLNICFKVPTAYLNKKPFWITSNLPVLKFKEQWHSFININSFINGTLLYLWCYFCRQLF